MKFLSKIPKWAFYFLSFTWGLPVTLIGCIVSLVLIILGYKPQKWGYCWYFQVGRYWGGMNLGPCFIRDKISVQSINDHEHGHGLQNCLFGPFMPFVVCLPSVIRYWYREFKYERKGIDPPTDYDAIWFERTATSSGESLKLKIFEK